MKDAASNPGSSHIIDETTAQAAGGGRSAVDIAALGALLRVPLPAEGELAQASFPTRSVQEGEVLIRAGDEYRELYVVRFGSFKTAVIDGAGTLQGTGFPMRGDVIGVEGFANGRHTGQATALERSEVVAVPVPKLTALAQSHSAFAKLVHGIMGREIVRDQTLMFVLGSLGAEARVAAFLLDLSERFRTLGYSRRVFNLRMTRQDMGDYLGLNVETVSRVMSNLGQMGLVGVRHREIEILDEPSLRELVANPAHLQTLRARVRAGNGAWSAPSRPVPSVGPVFGLRGSDQARAAAARAE